MWFVSVLCVFLVVPGVGLQCVIVTFPGNRVRLGLALIHFKVSLIKNTRFKTHVLQNV